MKQRKAYKVWSVKGEDFPWTEYFDTLEEARIYYLNCVSIYKKELERVDVHLYGYGKYIDSYGHLGTKLIKQSQTTPKDDIFRGDSLKKHRGKEFE